MAHTRPLAREQLGRNVQHVDVSSQAVDVALAAVAVKQYGNVTRSQLTALGLSHGAIVNRVANGRLFRVFRGVYSVGRRPVTALEWASAAVLAAGANTSLSHGSGMSLWGFWRRWDKPYEVTVVGDRRTKGIRVHRSTTLRRRDVTTQLGIRVTTPARTLLDISARLNDKSLKRTVNSALGSLWLTEDQLAEMLARHPNARGAERIAKLIGLEGTPTRSGWEDDFPAFCEKYGLPAPVMGVPMLGYIVDALFPAERVIVELDSWSFHKGKIPFEGDRDRDADALAQGFATVRITEERFDERPHDEAGRLHEILARRQADQAPRAA